MNSKDKKRKKLLKGYASLVKKGNFFPSLIDLDDIGFTREMIRQQFKTLRGLRMAAKEDHPEAFTGVADLDQYFDKSNLSRLGKEIKESKRFVITTAVTGQQLHVGFFNAIKAYCKYNDAKLLILPSHDPAHNLDNEVDWHFDPLLSGEDILFDEKKLNSNIFISDVRVTAKQINPVTGLSEISQNKGSFVFASPKQSLEFDSVSADKLPHARMSTGACTLPNYKTSRGNSLKLAHLATFQHVIGAVIVEIENDKIYHFRQIQSDANGEFCDLGQKYSPNGKISTEVPILIIGDYHAGEHDESAVKSWEEIIDLMKIEEVVFHDMFNGASINPHEEDNMMLRAERARKGLNILENELIIASREIDRVLEKKSIKKGIMVKSNHDDFIDRWLRKGKYSKDPANYEFGTELAANLIAASKKGIKKDFFKTGLELTRNPANADKIQWLTVDEDYIIGGVHLGAHGDKAANGARGSIRALSKSYPKCIIGHSHTPGIFKGVFQVGTSSLLRLGYNSGPSSWVHCSCLLYRNGQRQLINSIGGKWRLR